MLPRTVIALGMVSFFTDFSSEMIYPLLPVFLSTVLGAGALALGVIEGIAESTAALLKLFSGLWSDRTRRRTPLIYAGYSLAGFARPLIGLAGSWPIVLALRFTDRVGKGLRTAPRDALLADVTPVARRGEAYGFHRAMDHAGAVVGPLVAAGLLSVAGLDLRTVFLLAALPAIAVLVVMFGFVREPSRHRHEAPAPAFDRQAWTELSPSFKRLLVALLLFTLGNSTDAFLVLRLSDAGVPATWLALLWAAHHVVKMATTYVGGRLSDRIGRKALLLGGWIFYAGVYAAFAAFDSPAALVAIFLAYGIYFGMTEPTERAWIADLVAAERRGAAFGFYNATIGLAALPASLLFGAIWTAFGAPAAFLTGATLALTAAALLSSIEDHRHQ